MKNCAPRDASRYPNPTLMALDDRLADRQTHSHAMGFGREHWFKNLIEICDGDSAPDIRDRDTDAVIVGRFRFNGEHARFAADPIDSVAFITRFKITCCN